MKELITYSRQAAFKQCRRKHQIAYELGLRPIEDGRALRIGDATHKGLERLPDLEQACAAVRARYAYVPEKFDPYLWQIERETVLRLICCYQWRWQGQQLEVVATEQAFRLPLLNPATGRESQFFDLGGKIDGIVKLEDGRLAVKETKTCSDNLDQDSDYWRRLRIDEQISLYIDAARRLGHNVDTVLYDVIRKPTIAPAPVAITDERGLKVVLGPDGKRVCNTTGTKDWRQTADAAKGYVLQTRPMTVPEWGEKLSADIQSRPDFYFARREVPRLNQDVEEFQEELWQIQQAMREAQRTGKHYRTVTQNCVYCPYFHPCSEGVDMEREIPPGLELVTDRHPELSNGESYVTAVATETASPQATATGALEAVTV